MSRYIAVLHHWRIVRSLGFSVLPLAARTEAEAHLEASARLAESDTSTLYHYAYTLVELADHEHHARPLSLWERITGRFKGRG